MRLNLLGNVEVIRDTGEPIHIRGAKLKALVAILGSNHGHRVSCETLIDALWASETPKDPMNTLRHYVSRLRTSIDPDRAGLLENIAGGYRLSIATDVDCVEAVVTDGRQWLADGEPERALGCFDQALSFWRGEPFADIAGAAFAQPDISLLNELYVVVLENRFESALACGQHHTLIPELAAALERFPLRERICVLLMVALYRSGRQAEALNTYQRARKAAIDELGLEPSAELRSMEERILLRDPALNRANIRRSSGNVPRPATTFIGRTALVSQIGSHLEHHRVVTLTGPAGIGKTRLALEVLNETLANYSDGTWFVDLDETASDTLLERVASALPISRRGNMDLGESILAFFAERDSLIVIDGCERVSGAVCDLVSLIVARCSGTNVMTTGQRTLGCSGEIVVSVPPLDVAVTNSNGPELSEAVELFVERARQSDPRLASTDAFLVSASRICAAVDGVPLAIELAAARLRSLNPQQIEAGLVDRFTLLTRQARDLPARHRSLRSALDWSFRLLEEDHRRMMAHLGVFSGSFDLGAISSVLALSDESAVDLVRTLVDCSLIQRSAELAGDARYKLLDSVREYARLTMSVTEYARLRRMHAEYYAALADAADAGLKSREYGFWLASLDADADNFRAALDAATTGVAGRDLAIKLAARLGRYWDWTGALTEGRHWLSESLRLGSDHPDRALALVWSSYFDAETGDVASAIEQGKSAVMHASSEHLAVALGSLALTERQRGQHTESYALALRAIEQAEAQRQAWFSAWAESLAAMASLDLADLASARRHGERAQSAFARIGDRRGEGWCLAIRAMASTNDQPAEEAAGAALLLAHESGDEHTMEWMLRLLAGLYSRRGETNLAVQLLSAAESLATKRGASVTPKSLGSQARLTEQLRDQLDTEAFAVAWERGLHLALDDALQLAPLHDALPCSVLDKQ